VAVEIGPAKQKKERKKLTEEEIWNKLFSFFLFFWHRKRYML
jgi:hypothetical protein